ncbi:hypothetical protein VSH64_42195 [Amycolatopsis rhabdoformis]|uniref:Uncharacterized protein n=1 Tax=Amycolatopsis rhabdoformis TaxID=1448059 RepID=A0ABZ1I569_9PSEU|nr:hypothetical protein [Amycolatopsis rhabdoformis]WSE29349.1 hypothetical protein VSH64_42195 [Amycolatopsis rhabdoformis]
MITDDDSFMLVFGGHTTRAVTESPALAARGRTSSAGLTSPGGGVGVSDVGGVGEVVLDGGVLGLVASAANAGAAESRPAAKRDDTTAMRFMELPLK